MQRITSIDGLFHDGNPSLGTKGTILTAAWLNDLQESLISLVGNIKVVAANYLLLETDRVILIDTTSGPVTVHLPVYAGVAAFKEYKFKLISGDNPATIDCSDSKTIDTAATIVLNAPGDRATVVKDGTNWQTI